MPKIEIIGCMDNKTDHTFESANRIYGVGGLSPTIPTCAGGGIQPKVMEIQKIVYDDYNSRIRTGHKTMTTLTLNYGSSSIRNGVKIIESIKVAAQRGRYDENGKIVQQLEVSDSKCMNALTTVQKDNLLLETKIAQEVPTQFQKFIYEINGELYLIRIRKLTPKECWRLMDFSDCDYEKAASVNSNTQLYKQAGNSIVKNVLIAILGQLIPGKEDYYKKINEY